MSMLPPPYVSPGSKPAKAVGNLGGHKAGRRVSTDEGPRCAASAAGLGGPLPAPLAFCRQEPGNQLLAAVVTWLGWRSSRTALCFRRSGMPPNRASSGSLPSRSTRAGSPRRPRPQRRPAASPAFAGAGYERRIHRLLKVVAVERRAWSQNRDAYRRSTQRPRACPGDLGPASAPDGAACPGTLSPPRHDPRAPPSPGRC